VIEPLALPIHTLMLGDSSLIEYEAFYEVDPVLQIEPTSLSKDYIISVNLSCYRE